jgi:hypothetical protein
VTAVLFTLPSIEAGLAKVGKIDALVVTAGSVDFKPLVAIEAAPLEASVYALGLRNKLMGQVRDQIEASRWVGHAFLVSTQRHLQVYDQILKRKRCQTGEFGTSCPEAPQRWRLDHLD